jgi:transposase
MLSVASNTRIFVSEKPCDMRSSFEGLSYRVREVLKEDPLCGHLFVFFNRNRDKMKILYFDHTGFAIWYKELQRGTFSCPEKREISRAELGCILEGLEIAGIRRKKRFLLRNTVASSACV